MKVGLLISILLAFSAIYFQRKFYEKSRIFNKRFSDGLLEVWQGMASSLKRLLLSDIMARLASNMIKTYIVLYVINVLGCFINSKKCKIRHLFSLIFIRPLIYSVVRSPGM